MILKQFIYPKVTLNLILNRKKIASVELLNILKPKKNKIVER